MQRRLRGHAEGALPGLPEERSEPGPGPGPRQCPAHGRRGAGLPPPQQVSRCPPPTEGCGRAHTSGCRPRAAPTAAPSAAARAPLASAPPPHLGLRSLRGAERRGGTSPRGRVLGARRSPLLAGRCVPPPPLPPRNGAGGAAGPPRAARRGCGADRGVRCDSSAIWRPPPPFGFSPLSDVAPARALRTRDAGGRACAARGAKPLPGGARGRWP